MNLVYYVLSQRIYKLLIISSVFIRYFRKMGTILLSYDLVRKVLCTGIVLHTQ